MSHLVPNGILCLKAGRRYSASDCALGSQTPACCINERLMMFSEQVDAKIRGFFKWYHHMARQRNSEVSLDGDTHWRDSTPKHLIITRPYQYTACPILSHDSAVRLAS